MVSIAGGKLTGYRKMAERVVNRIAKEMEEDHDWKLEPCTTDKIPLCGSDFKKYKHVKKYIATVYDRLHDNGFSEHDAWYLVTTYGKQTETILELYAQVKAEDSLERMIRAEAQFTIAHEMALNPLDFFIRRTGRLYFAIESVRNYMGPVLEEFRTAYGYSSEEMDAFRTEMEGKLKEHSNFSLDRD